ncbi:MAG TPA: cytochrome c oxidase subunit 3, partial [Candidatus Binataceae bacterium]|nr:cytochrome c oxidase subunit 3 [Candidatus Binataceae bacterium]
NFFGVLIVGYIYFYLNPSAGPTAAASLDPLRTLGFSIALFLSSATMHLAGRSFQAGSNRGVSLWLAVTVTLGAVFLVGQGLEYTKLIDREITVSTDLFGSTFFTLTGFHGLHVLIGLCALGTLLGAAVSGRFNNIKREGFEAISMYWHFVDAVWVVIFAIVYAWPFLTGKLA